jgi:hypothetical protein
MRKRRRVGKRRCEIEKHKQFRHPACDHGRSHNAMNNAVQQAAAVYACK